MSHNEPVSIACPYCGEALDIEINTETRDQDQQDTCHICRQTITIHTHIENGVTQVSVVRKPH